MKKQVAGALWQWPEERAQVARMQQELAKAGSAFDVDGELGRWLAELTLQSDWAEEPTTRATFLARGLRLLAAAQAVSPARRPEPPPVDPSDVPSALTALRGCGPKTAARLAGRGIRDVDDLLALLPLHYEDRRQVVALGDLVAGQAVSCGGVIDRVGWRGRPGRRFLEITLAEGDQRLICRWFRVHPGLAKRFARGMEVTVTGQPREWKNQLQMIHPEIREAGQAADEARQGIVPRYPIVEGVGQRLMQKLCAQAVDRLDDESVDPVPEAVRAPLGLPDRQAALRHLHAPDPGLCTDELHALETRRSWAHRRLAFEEVFLLQLGLALRRQEVRSRVAPAAPASEDLDDRLAGVFPFTLTAAQQRVIQEIRADLAETRPMHRLVQGDVGSGKTAVAFAAAEQVMAAGGQVALMAPTEILAAQHLSTLKPWAEALGRRVTLLTASTPRGVKESTLSLLQAGQLPFVVGTHALLAERVAFERLGLAIVDEQHRFGVAQRARLRDKGETGESAPHLLVMTATPIPRTLALTVYGDLDLSLVDELPPGRSAARTHVFEAARRDRLYERVQELLDQSKQAFVICPLVEASDKLDLADAEKTYADLTERLAPHPVGLVHGRLGSTDKLAVLDRFRRGDLRVLVATTVVEVGVDVPDAEIMIVESAQRFGLAQLHQLRGRVGRRARADALCLLVVDAGATEEALRRLQVMESTSDGFRIAEEDLLIRGPGELLGLRQAGVANHRLMHLAAHPDLIAAAREAARELIRADPELDRPDHRLTRQWLEARWQGRLFGEETG